MPACHWTVDFACGTRREVKGESDSPFGPFVVLTGEGQDAAQRAQPCCRPPRTKQKRCAVARAPFGRIAGNSCVKYLLFFRRADFPHSGSGHACKTHRSAQTFQTMLREPRFREAQQLQACQARPFWRRLRLAASSPEPEHFCHNGFPCALASLMAPVLLWPHPDNVMVWRAMND